MCGMVGQILSWGDSTFRLCVLKGLFKGWRGSVSAALLHLPGEKQRWLVTSPVGASHVNWCLARLFSLPDGGGDEGAWVGRCRRLATVLGSHWFFPPAAVMSLPPGNVNVCAVHTSPVGLRGWARVAEEKNCCIEGFIVWKSSLRIFEPLDWSGGTRTQVMIIPMMSLTCGNV